MIPPGGEGKIQVTLKPKGRATTITKRIVVHSDDPEQPEFTLTMTGKLLIDVMSEPRAITLRDLKVNERGSKRFELLLNEGAEAELVSVTLEDEENFTLTRLPDDAPLVEVEPEAEGTNTAASLPATTGKRLGIYEVEFHGRDTVGTSKTRVVAKTTGANTPEVVVTVHASAAANLRYLKTLRFIRKNGKLLSRELHVSARHGDRPTITKVEDPDGLLNFEILEPRGKLASVRLEVKEEAWEALDPEQKKATHELIVHTTDREEPKITINYGVAGKSRGKQSRVAPIEAHAAER